MKRRIVMFVLVLAAFLLQSTLLQTISLASVTPNLMLVFTVSFALMRGKREGMFVGFLSGILTDVFLAGEFLECIPCFIRIQGILTDLVSVFFMMMISRCPLSWSVPAIWRFIYWSMYSGSFCGDGQISFSTWDVLLFPALSILQY